MSFYRIYRPQTIEELDNQVVRDLLATLAQKAKKDLPHAYLFYGPKGAGKTTAARIVAKLFNCTKPKKNGSPCGKCNMCTSVAENRNLDVLEIDAASNRGIDEIRELRMGISLAPASAAYKVYIIDEVHMLTTEAFNALLKTLEEPPVHAVFVLATTNLEKVPATILSRCLLVPFSRVQIADLVEALSRIVKEEKIKIDDSTLSLLASYADGSFRDAVKMLEQVSFHKGKITQEVVAEILAVSGEAAIFDFLEHITAKQKKEALRDISILIREGKDIKTFLVDCLYSLERQLLEAAQGKKGAHDPQTLQELIRRLSQAYTELRSSPIPELPLELAIVEYCEENVIGDTQPDQSPVASHPSLAEDDAQQSSSLGLLTTAKLTEHWPDFIAAMKSYNHSVAGFLRSTRPTSVKNGIVTIVAFYKFHQEKLAEVKIREAMAETLKKLFGEKVKIEVVLGKK